MEAITYATIKTYRADAVRLEMLKREMEACGVTPRLRKFPNGTCRVVIPASRKDDARDALVMCHCCWQGGIAFASPESMRFWETSTDGKTIGIVVRFMA